MERTNVVPPEATTFLKTGLKGRSDLQSLLYEQVQVTARDTVVVAEESGEWEDTQRRVEPFGLDQDTGLVMMGLKRTADGEHTKTHALGFAATACDDDV